MPQPYESPTVGCVKGVFFYFHNALGNWQEWYILERNQRILFQQIQKLAELFSGFKPAEETSALGDEGSLERVYYS